MKHDLESLFIEKLRRIADQEISFNLMDDVAQLPSRSLIFSSDMSVDGLHFKLGPSCDTGMAVRKWFRSNISDLAAKGARPVGYSLAIAFPAQFFNEGQFRHIIAALSEEQSRYGLKLWGGDTVAGASQFTLSGSFFGEALAPDGRAVLRSGAQPGQDIWLAGKMGDGFLGLQKLQGRATGDLSKPEWDIAVQNHLLPEIEPRRGDLIGRFANAAIDISDGLWLDASRLARSSHVELIIETDRLPWSVRAKKWLNGKAKALEPEQKLTLLLIAADDYLCLFTAAQEYRSEIDKITRQWEIPVRQIGRVTVGNKVKMMHSNGLLLQEPEAVGWSYKGVVS